MTELVILRGGHMKEGDTSPDLRVQCMEADSSFNLSDYEVTLHLRKAEADSRAVDTVVSTPAKEDENQRPRGIVSYSWSASDTKEAGSYICEMVAEHTSTTEQITFPNSGYTTVYIEEHV